MFCVRSFLFCFATTFVLFSSPRGLGQDTALDVYKEGLTSFQEQNFEAAESRFAEALEKDPNNPYALYNWGLSKLKLGKAGWAFAAWRKALHVDPGLSSASRGLDYLIKNFSLPGRKGPAGHWEVFRAKFLAFIPLTALFFAAALLLSSAGWLLIKYAANRKVAVEEELPLPSPPWLGLLFGLLFLVFQAIAFAKLYDGFQPRGVVVVEITQVLSAPEPESSVLFEILEGAEVLILRKNGDWAQIQYPSGLAGWIPTSTVFQTSGQEL